MAAERQCLYGPATPPPLFGAQAGQGGGCLPRSMLLMPASAFAGRERILAAYETAKQEEYRFYSLSDAMVIV